MSTPVETRDSRNAFARPQEENRTVGVAAGGSFVEAIGGVATVVLAIIALAGLPSGWVLSGWLMDIAIIVFGAALISEGGAIAVRYCTLLETPEHSLGRGGEMGSGMTVEFLGGVAGIVLGILALCRLAPMVLPPVAVLVFGASVLIGSGATAWLNDQWAERSFGPTDSSRRLAGEMTSASSGARLLVGLASVVLGILGLVIPGADWTLTLVALLCLGAFLLLNGAVSGGRMMTMFRR